MGFGKKTDYRHGKDVDLDIIYRDVIKPVFQDSFPEYEVLRADEITSSGLIDESMYALLIHADLVIADLTTMNENAIYELGVRHAVKPFSTIIMMQKSDKGYIPFDLNHCRFYMYDDFGEKLSIEEATKIKEGLKKYIKACEFETIDSPFYVYLPNVIQPSIDVDALKDISEVMKKKEISIAHKLDEVEKLKHKADSGSLDSFYKAYEILADIHKSLPSNEYIVQQMALTRYKSQKPNKTVALEEAALIINRLNPKNSLDFETIGIAGAIQKNLYRLNNNVDYLENAIELYRRGYSLANNYYNGENYANCLCLKYMTSNITDEEKVYLRYESRRVYQNIANALENVVANDDEVDYWVYATLSTCYYVLGKDELFHEYAALFDQHKQSQWEKDTYEDNLDLLKMCFQDKESLM